MMPAAPTGDYINLRLDGMTIRDYFAAVAIAGQVDVREDFQLRIVTAAYQMADAMLAERAKGDRR